MMPASRKRSPATAATVVVSVVTFVGAVSACRGRTGSGTSAEASSSAFRRVSPTSGSASASTNSVLPPVVRVDVDAGPLAKGIPVPAASVEKEVNPAHLEPYAGPVGSIEGVVHVRGDEPLSQSVAANERCADARSFYGKVFREGEGRTLADAIVAVTEYKGYVPPQGDSVRAKIIGCSFDRRTYALTYGQNLEVVNLNSSPKLSFVPDLKGAYMPAQMVAVPRGDPVQLYPKQPGLYELRDDLGHPYMAASVYVVRYSTHAVTGLDGKYRISGIPVGNVKVSALQPTMEKAEQHEVEIKANETAKVDFELTYKKKQLPDPKVSMDPYIK